MTETPEAEKGSPPNRRNWRPGDEDAASLAARINEAHRRAVEHVAAAGEHIVCSVEHALTCGELLLKAKAEVPHGQWLPWLRANVTFSERSAQGYMEVAREHRSNPQRVADMSLRRMLKTLRTPARAKIEEHEKRIAKMSLSELVVEKYKLHMLGRLSKADREAMDAELQAHIARKPPPLAPNGSIEEMKATIDHVRALDEIMHKYGMCPWAGTDNPGFCLVCAKAMDDAGTEYDPEDLTWLTGT
jgi:hypothetical protein